MKIAYVELPAKDVDEVARLKEFYGTVMEWQFEDWGPEYAAFSNAGLDGGVHGGTDGRPTAPLVIVETRDLVAAEAAVQAAGGVVTAPIFAYPGGRRFHFRDPAGNELAVLQHGD